jgi:signal transduction histidine kinase/CheY-like chemotaxis protein
MLVRLRENARTMRALVAMVAATGLALLIYNSEQNSARVQAHAVREINAMLWGISELNFEAQRVVNALNGLSARQIPLEEVQLRFDVMWSRLNVVRLERFDRDTGFHELMAEFRTFLDLYEPVLFSGTEPTDAQLTEMSSTLLKMSISLRQLWSRNFGSRNPASEVLSDMTKGSNRHQEQIWGFVLIAILVTYVVAEVYVAGRAQKREARLHLLAAQASAAKSRFLANVSHEIRTPLNGILGMASELSESPLDADQSQCVRVIEDSGSVLLHTINDVLDLSKVEAGHFQIEIRPLLLRELLEAARALYDAKAREKGLTLKVAVQDNLPQVVMGDSCRLRQILHNLIANAVKFTETGSVTLRAAPSRDGRSMVISVRDTGPGIPVDARKRIFEPFGQADSSVTRLHGGTGLGLAISRQLCEAMGGSLTLVSQLGRGTTFYCDLPLEAADAAEVEKLQKPAAQNTDLTGCHLLLADDNATNLLILQRFLKNTGADLDTATNGAEALEMASQTRYDAILMDVQMPRLDGVGATVELRALEAERGDTPTPVIAVTANVMAHQVEEYRAAGMGAHLAKPVSKRDLLALLSELLSDKGADASVSNGEPVMRGQVG